MIQPHTAGILILMSSDRPNVGYTVSMIAAMLLLSENRACHSLRAKERILRALP